MEEEGVGQARSVGSCTPRGQGTGASTPRSGGQKAFFASPGAPSPAVQQQQVGGSKQQAPEQEGQQASAQSAASMDLDTSQGSSASAGGSNPGTPMNSAAVKARRVKPQLDMSDTLQVSMDVSEILPHLYLGAKAVSEDWDALTELGIRNIINCTTEPRSHFADRGVNYFQVSVEDDPNANIEPFFISCADFVERARESQSKVLVHCTMGMSRSSTVVVAYLMQHEKMCLRDAMALAKERRAMVSPNSGFMRQLCELEKKLFGEITVSLEHYSRDRFAPVSDFSL